MKKNRIVWFAFGLLFLSTAASAGVPPSPNSQDVDIGTLSTLHYQTAFMRDTNLLHNSYTFDLASASRVDVFLYNPLPETAFPNVVFTNYVLSILDNQNNTVLTGVEEGPQKPYGSTAELKLVGVLPAGNDYYVKIDGYTYPTATPILEYQLDMVAFAVPEPETYAMLLAGLGLVGFITRRRKQIS